MDKIIFNEITIASGDPEQDAIRSLTFTESVNNDADLMPGTVGIGTLDLELYSKQKINAGDKIEWYRDDKLKGTFWADKPTRGAVYSVTAYDALSKSEKDLSTWLRSIQGQFPISLLDFARMVCEQCNLSLVNEEIPNGSYQIRAFYTDDFTARKALEWVGQACGRFCRATPDGKVEFAWYTPPDWRHSLGPGEDGLMLVRLAGETLRVSDRDPAAPPEGPEIYRIPFKQTWYYQLAYEDFETAVIDKVQINQSENDVGVIYPADAVGTNALTITGNMLLTTDTDANLRPVAKTLYEQFKEIRYVPCQVEVPPDSDLRAGMAVWIKTPEDTTILTYITDCTVDTTISLDSVGNASRDATTAVNEHIEKNLRGKMLEIQTSVDGLKVTASEIREESKKYTDDTLNDFVEKTLDPELANLQKQIDGQIESYYYDYEPLLTNAPANGWTNDTEKTKHEGDLFYNKATGYAYRFFKDGSTWKWQLIQDTDITKALEAASAAQDTADYKRRVFVDTPKPPYDVGDLWVQGSNGDILRCAKAKTSGSYASGDFVKASKYTDDSALTDFKDGEFQTTVTDLHSEISQTAENITTLVEATYTTKTELSQAKTDAAADATSKANAAQAAAEKTAAADATAKANAAQKAANDATDEKLKSYSTTVEMQSAIEQTAGSITSTVTEVKKTADAASEKATKIEQTVNGLTLEVSNEYTDDLLAGQITKPYTLTNDGGPIKSLAIYIPSNSVAGLANHTIKFGITFKKIQECTGAGVSIWVYYNSGNKYYTLAGTSDINAADDWQTKELTVQIEGETPTFVFVYPYIAVGTVGSYQFENVHAYVAADNKTLLALKSGSTELSSANITLSGVVTFQNLKNEGETVINGSNIKTGVVQSKDGTTIYDLDNGTIQMGATNGKHVLITNDTIRWYLGTNAHQDGGPTGVFYSEQAKSYIGSTSTYNYFGWIDKDHTKYYGMLVENDQNAHFNTVKLECGGRYNNDDGTVEANSLVGNYLTVRVGGKGAVVPTKTYGNIRMISAESPIPQFFDNGSGVLDETGKCWLFLRDEFLSAVSCNVVPQWHITGAGPLTVKKQGLSALVEGEPNTTFDWLCIMPQLGCESMYCEPFDYGDTMDKRDYVAREELDIIEQFEKELNDEVFTVSSENSFIEETWPEQVERSVYA